MTNGVTRRTAVLAGLTVPLSRAASPERKLRIAIFSKHLQFLEGEELARAAATLGFNGIDLTVRKGGHIEPARAAEDLPPLAALIRAHGLDIPMVTTDIIDSASPHARTVLKTLAKLGIRYYRWGGFTYDAHEPISRQFSRFHERAAGLAALNAEYGVCAIYHTHSGVGLVGAPVWDIFEILKNLDSRAVAINYDIGHATIEGGLGGWIDSFRAAEGYIRGLAFKDFLWRKNAAGVWDAVWVPLGEGMVRFPTFCTMLQQSDFDGPVQLHFEYPLGGADAGKRTITVGRNEVFAAMRRDLSRLRGYLRSAGVACA